MEHHDLQRDDGNESAGGTGMGGAGRESETVSVLMASETAYFPGVMCMEMVKTGT
jgi:hypothetical protein